MWANRRHNDFDVMTQHKKNTQKHPLSCHIIWRMLTGKFDGDDKNANKNPSRCCMATPCLAASSSMPFCGYSPLSTHTVRNDLL